MFVIQDERALAIETRSVDEVVTVQALIARVVFRYLPSFSTWAIFVATLIVPLK